MRNELVLEGALVDAVQLRYSPAGVAVARFTLEHISHQREASQPRRIKFLVGVRAAGERLREALGEPAPGTPIRVAGFLARARLRDSDHRLIIVASQVEWLTTAYNDLE